jgi:outer membrane biosynthesis protein TonB
VAEYLKRTKSAHKTSVTFDYETEAFVPVEDGEFVVVHSGEQNVQPIVLPRATRFAARRDFYEFYQDYYHCQKPDAGEVHIVRPAAVNRSGAGWKLQTTGLLEVVPEQPKKKPVEVPAPAPVAQKRVEEPAPRPAVIAAPPTVANPTVANPPVPNPPVQNPSVPSPAPQRSAQPAPKKEQPAVTVCNGCGASIEARYAFCWKCGSAMAPQQESNGPVVVRSRLRRLPTDDDELTMQHDQHGGGGGNSMFSWTMSKPPDDDPSTSKGSVLKLMAIGGVAFLLLALGFFGLRGSDSQVASANSTPPVVEQQPVTQPEPEPAPQQTATVATEQKPQPTPVTPEDELKKLREKRMGASDSDRSKIFQAIAKVERQYPRDYRFPYERAKLAAKGSKANSRNEAFKALSVAAEKAISTGKASEMLSGLEADKAGDFQKLAQGRQEWTKLLTALKRKDMSLLAKAQFQ